MLLDVDRSLLFFHGHYIGLIVEMTCRESDKEAAFGVFGGFRESRLIEKMSSTAFESRLIEKMSSTAFESRLIQKMSSTAFESRLASSRETTRARPYLQSCVC